MDYQDQLIDPSNSLLVNLDPCQCVNLTMRVSHYDKDTNIEKWAENIKFEYSPNKFINDDDPNELVCRNQENKLSLNRNYSVEAWMLRCVTNVFVETEVAWRDLKGGPIDYHSNGNNVSIKIEYCPNTETPLLTKYIPLPLKECEGVNNKDEAGEEDSLTVAGIPIGNYLAIVIPIIGIGIVIAALKTIFYCKQRKDNESQTKVESETYNPMYGMDQYQDYGDYYVENRIEETNPDYDAYYKEYTSNITDGNELYG